MTEETNGAAPAAAETVSAPISIPESMTPREAAGMLGKINKEPPATPPEAGAAAEESAPHGDDAGPDEPVPGETEGEADPAEEPSIDAPRSWSKEHKDAFKSLPPHLQQMVADSERAREADFLRRQNEAAEERKAASAEKQAAEQARQQYEAALPNLLHAIEQQVAGEFSDIKSWDDVNRLAQEDPVRYMQWDASQKRLQAVRSEADRVGQQQAAEVHKQWTEFTAKEDQAFRAKVPEFSDPQKAARLQGEARTMLSELGFTDGELQALWNGQSGISLRDHRLQLLLLDGVRLRTAKAQVKNPAPKPVTPVQRPGTAPARGEASAEAIQALKSKLERTGDIKDAVALLQKSRKRA